MSYVLHLSLFLYYDIVLEDLNYVRLHLYNRAIFYMNPIHTRSSGLDLLRSIAIISVLVLHQTQAIYSTPEWIKIIGRYGWSGVDIFFVLSGFLIGSQVFKADSNIPFLSALKTFWIKRWYRTLPLYFVVLVFYLFIKPTILQFPFQGNSWTYFFFLQNLFGIGDFPQSWSLCIEEHFYLIFPLFAFSIPKLKKKPFLLIIPLILSFLIRIYIVSTNNIQGEPSLSYLIRFPTYTNIDGISMGVFLAYTQDYWVSYAKRYALGLFTAGIVFFSISLFLVSPVPIGIWAILFPTLLACGASLMTMGASKLNLPKAITPIVYWISLGSYGMYLWNNVFMRAAEKYLQNVHWVFASLFCYGLTILFAFITYKLVEEPFLKLRDKILLKRV